MSRLQNIIPTRLCSEDNAITPQKTKVFGGVIVPFYATLCQGAIVGADVVGDDIVDKILGPNKKKRRIMHATNEHASDIKSRGAEQPPAWEEAPNDIESRFDSTTSTRYTVFAVSQSLHMNGCYISLHGPFVNVNISTPR